MHTEKKQGMNVQIPAGMRSTASLIKPAAHQDQAALSQLAEIFKRRDIARRSSVVELLFQAERRLGGSRTKCLQFRRCESPPLNDTAGG